MFKPTLQQVLIGIGFVIVVILAIVMLCMGKTGIGMAWRMFLKLLSQWYSAAIEKLDGRRRALMASEKADDEKLKALAAQRVDIEKKRQETVKKTQEMSNAELAADLRSRGW